MRKLGAALLFWVDVLIIELLRVNVASAAMSVNQDTVRAPGFHGFIQTGEAVPEFLTWPSVRPDDAPVTTSFSARTVALLFAVVLGLYVVVFYGIEHLRQRRGPWEVEFMPSVGGSPVVVVSEPKLRLQGVKIVFHGELATNNAAKVLFDQVKRPVPFGKVIYEDLTFLPGVVTFDLFGHEVELLPRVLIVNKRPIEWRSGRVIDLWPTNKPVEPPQPPKTRSR